MSTQVLEWDWRDQPDLDALALAIKELSGGKVQAFQVNTSSDSYGLVLTNEPMTAKQAHEAWQQSMPTTW